jgi:hypothetical protein
MPEYVRVPVRYPIAASVQHVTAAIDDLKSKGVDGFATLVKTGPATYIRTEIEDTKVYDEEGAEFDVSMSTVINFAVVPVSPSSARRRRQISKSGPSFLRVSAEVWIGECPTGPSHIEVGEATVDIHNKLDPLVAKIVETLNRYKVASSLEQLD